ncbi:kinesin-13, putative [Hepatocystis sp. ex Piliocolobus tephrosceles]|nr:kinesin-13, putative [Hepatocystis sp. ex Piliocolobus tephrosceles]
MQKKSEIYAQKNVDLGQKPKSRNKVSNGKIKVVVRKRPINENEKRKNDYDIITVKDNCTVYIDEPRYKVDMTRYIEKHEFLVDKVFDETVNNFSVYVHTIKPLIIDLFENNCVCSCFAYGQTGSGKTYTMLGSQPYGQSEYPGIFQYAAEDIFNFLNIYDRNTNNKGIYISFYEIYCGKLYDLLQKRKMVAALENSKKEVIVKDLKILRVLSKEELIQKMIEGVLLRKIGVNSQNDESSRSHAILNIDLKDINKNISLGKIAFIDLAGSERGADTIAQNKQTQTDGANINRSLLALKECIRAMDSDKTHIPFRDSELTKVLRDIFVGRSKSVMIANISPTISSCEQTLNTLRYSSRVKNFKTRPIINEQDELINNENNTIMDIHNNNISSSNNNNNNISSSSSSNNNNISSSNNSNSTNNNYYSVENMTYKSNSFTNVSDKLITKSGNVKKKSGSISSNSSNRNSNSGNSGNSGNSNSQINYKNKNRLNSKSNYNIIKNSNNNKTTVGSEENKNNTLVYNQYNSINNMNNITTQKKKKINNVLSSKNKSNSETFNKKTYMSKQNIKQQNKMQKNYIYSDASDFSSLDEMNDNLKNNNNNIFTVKKKIKQDYTLKNRLSYDNNTNNKIKKNEAHTYRHSIGNRLSNYVLEKGKVKNKFENNNNNSIFIDPSINNHHIIETEHMIDTMGNINNKLPNQNVSSFATITTATTTANNSNSSNNRFLHTMKNINEKDAQQYNNNNNDNNIFYDAVSQQSNNINRIVSLSTKQFLNNSMSNILGQSTLHKSYSNTGLSGLTELNGLTGLNGLTELNGLTGLNGLNDLSGLSGLINYETSGTERGLHNTNIINDLKINKSLIESMNNNNNVHINNTMASMDSIESVDDTYMSVNKEMENFAQNRGGIFNMNNNNNNSTGTLGGNEYNTHELLNKNSFDLNNSFINNYNLEHQSCSNNGTTINNINNNSPYIRIMNNTNENNNFNTNENENINSLFINKDQINQKNVLNDVLNDVLNNSNNINYENNTIASKVTDSTSTYPYTNSNSTDSKNYFYNEYKTDIQKNKNSMLNNGIDSLNINNASESTQHILNTVLLSKYKTDKNSIIKKYINKDINNLSLEQLDQYVQIIYEKKKTILTKLLVLFKKNVEIQTNNETSDLKKDLVMCHICSNNPDDQFHFYAYSRLEKDIINLIMLRQLWCEGENLRLLHQLLITEYQNKSANSILFNVHPSLNKTGSLNKKYVEDTTNNTDSFFNKNDNLSSEKIIN